MTTIVRLTQAQWTTQRKQVDPVFGQGYLLYHSLCESLQAHRDNPAVVDFWRSLEEAHQKYLLPDNKKSFAELLPSYSKYKEAGDRWGTLSAPPTSPTSPAPAPDPTDGSAPTWFTEYVRADRKVLHGDGTPENPGLVARVATLEEWHNEQTRPKSFAEKLFGTSRRRRTRVGH
ncbi:hypothetical protein EOL96_02085 [Candidatus Saccharibacteria bacterium]|nr:hypothetical protein [Candidatus Saccharibacteria bacterium]